MLRFSVLERMWKWSGLQQPPGKSGPPGRRQFRLLSVHEVAEVHKEPGIISGYVPHGSPWLCVCSLFLATNETINFWTHFLPALYFVWKLVELQHTLDLNDRFSWPYFCYMLTTCVYPLVSCVAHAFSSMSIKAAHVGFFIDYGAISIFGYGVGVLYRSYCFPEGWIGTWYGDYFLYVCFINTIVCTMLACRSRFVARGAWQKCTRLLAFLVPYAWDNTPLLYRLWTCGGSELSAAAASCQVSAAFHVRQLTASALGSFFYGTHLPERMAPGRFDIIGHSHNFLHVLGILATNEQMNGALLDMQLRRQQRAGPERVLLDGWATWGCALAALINVAIVTCSAVMMCRRVDRQAEHKQKRS